MTTAADIDDLRSALEFLAGIPGQLVSTGEPVDPVAELAGVYRRVGAGIPVGPQRRPAPAMRFDRVKGYDMPVVVGVLGTRERTALLLDTTPERLGFAMLDALEHPEPPVTVAGADAPCQQVVVRPPFDLERLIPAPTNTRLDAGPYFCTGLLRAEDPDTGERDVTIHRLCVQGPDRLSVYFAPGRHIDRFRATAERAGRAILQFAKATARDEGRQRQAALTAFAAFPELKHVILVDDDVDPFDSDDVLWAMTTRYQGDVSTVFIPGVRCHPLDPSQSPAFSRSIAAEGISCKTIFDCTVPFHLKDRFRRAPFDDVDPTPFLPDA